MYSTSASVRGSALPVPLRLTRVLHGEFGAGGHRIGTPDLVRYFHDLTNSHGVAFRHEDVEEAVGNTFIGMAARLLDGELPASEPIDVVVVAHTTPDFDPRLSAPVNLTAVLPGGPLVFAVSGPAASAAFTALHVVSAHVRRHNCRRALVLVMDQSTMPYPTRRPAGDAASALVLEATGTAANLATGLFSDVAPHDIPAILAGSGPDPVTVVTGGGLDPDRLPFAGAESRRAERDYPCTGVWGVLAAGPVRGRTLLADYDPLHGDLGMAVVTGGL